MQYNCLCLVVRLCYRLVIKRHGDVAQLGEHHTGSVRVWGSSPHISTSKLGIEVAPISNIGATSISDHQLAHRAYVYLWNSSSGILRIKRIVRAYQFVGAPSVWEVCK